MMGQVNWFRWTESAKEVGRVLGYCFNILLPCLWIAQGIRVMNKKVCPDSPATGGEQVVELDTELWKELPEEILDKVICKLPFSSLVAFRAVSKEWSSIKIPLAASHTTARPVPALVYFNHDPYLANYPTWWLQVCNKTDGLRESGNHFQPASFPKPSQNESVLLLASEEGLLFFGFMDNTTSVMQDFVVCNPLTGKSKPLARLPCPLQAFGDSHIADKQNILMGVACVETGSYQLVVRGLERDGPSRTFLHDSSSGIWTSYSSLLLPDAVTAAEEDEVEEFEGRISMPGRSVYCNGKLYWFAYVKSNRYRSHNIPVILKFNMAAHLWTVIRLPPDLICRQSFGARSQIAMYKDKVLLWHLHEDGSSHRRLECPSDCSDGDCAARYCKTWASDERALMELQLHPDLKLISHNMIAEIEGILDFDEHNLKCREVWRNYVGYSHENVFFHILGVSPLNSLERKCSLRIITHKVTQNDMGVADFVLQAPQDQKYSRLDPDCVWVFVPSLTAAP